jgi:Rod binding domain-containing protein
MVDFGLVAAHASRETSISSRSRVAQAAHEFEAQMLNELMRPLNRESALDSEGSGDDCGPGSTGAIGDFASQALAWAISEGGGFGIASMIVRQLTPAGTQNETVPVTGLLYGNTQMKSAE